jgi:hypothetical protein
MPEFLTAFSGNIHTNTSSVSSHAEGDMRYSTEKKENEQAGWEEERF